MSKLMKDYDSINWSDYFIYDITSPTCLRWREDNPNNECNLPLAVRGKPAGALSSLISSQVDLNYESYLVHRVIMCLHGHVVHGKVVDHIDGNPHNNLYPNLRLVSRSVNGRNLKLSVANKSGVNGVRLDSKNNRYVASYNNLVSKTISKYFSIKKLGQDEAFRLACEWRLEKLKELNEKGAGYTERHMGIST